jgi:hypothetical protein
MPVTQRVPVAPPAGAPPAPARAPAPPAAGGPPAAAPRR